MATSALTPNNYYSSTLTSSVNTTDTTIFINGALPGGNEGYLELDEGLSSKEIIYYTSKGANFVTLPSVGAGRGVGGTSASAHSSGATVKQKLNAEWWLKLQDGTAQGVNSVAAQSLATNAITLGYTSIVGNVTLTTPTISTLITGMTVTVTVPAGGRKVKITVFGDAITCTLTAQITLSIWDGTVGSGTKLSTSDFSIDGGTPNAAMVLMAVAAPAAGAKTYNVGIIASAGNPTVNAGATNPAFILVEAI